MTLALAQRTIFQPSRPSAPKPRRDDRVLFVPERPVLSFMEGFVSGEQENSVREQLTIQILTQIRDHLALIERKQDAFGVEQHAQSERIVRLEERNERLTRLEVALSRESGRVDMLMTDLTKREGAIGLIEWVSRHWPFTLVSAGIAGFVAYANGLLGKG